MSVNEPISDGVERDPQLTRLYQAAGGEEPPSALDDAIRAAARREVHARPVGQGGVRPKRSWYVPMSIAAVLVLSVSLVTLMKEEKGGELFEAPRNTGVAPAPVPALPAEAPATARSDAALKDAARSSTQPAETAKADTQSGMVKPQAEREQAPARQKQYAPIPPEKKTESVVAERPPAAIARRDAPSAAMVERSPQPSPEPFPMARERAETESAQVPRETARSPAQDSSAAAKPSQMVSGALMAKPRARPAPESEPAAPETPRAPDGGGRFAQGRPSSTLGIRGLDSSPLPAESRVDNRPPASADAASGVAPPPAAPPPPLAAAPAPPLAKRAQRLEQAQASLLWRDLDNQPPEKWLERIAELRRQDRGADADELMAEFRRRFPDHPSAQR